jgi:hypothetical protein
MRRLLRVLTVVAAAAAMVGAATTPASAGDGGVAVFNGTATIDQPGIGYPCTSSSGPTVNTTECPTPNPHPTCVTTGLKKCKPIEFTTNDNDMLNGSFSSSECVGTEVNAGVKYPNKDKDPVSVGTCEITADFTVLGYCGLSTGEGLGLLTATNAVTGESNVTLFDFVWTSTATFLVLRIQWWKVSWQKPANPNKGIAVVSAFPSLPQSLPVVGTQSCTNHTQRDFSILGAGVFLPVKNLP